jgi:quercetin 2,3-dioxygenase
MEGVAMSVRNVEKVVTSHRQLEGGGFVVRRPFPSQAFRFADPFLLLDEMGPVDYAPGKAVGAPDHPHRGFETVTYVLEGEMEHEDSAGNRGKLASGDVQWMTAGRGVVHSEMPSQKMQTDGGRMHGFQLWVNLPARDKMIAPRYQEIGKSTIPSATSPDGLARVTVIAGEALGIKAAIETRTPIAYHHWQLSPGASISTSIPDEYRTYVYVFEGSALVAGKKIEEGQLAVLGAGDTVELAAEEKAQLLLLAGVPLKEPVVQHGPFVMNTQDQIYEAIDDYRHGRIGAIQR